MKYSFLIVGLFFLITPELSFVDFLPDFIGLLLIAKAITPLGAVSPSAENSSLLFKKAALMSGIQCAFLLPMISVTVSDAAMQLVFVLVFALLRLLYIVPAFHDLFASLRYFTERHGTSVRGLTAVSCMTTVAIFAHAILTVLPQTVYLKVEEFGVRYPLTADNGGNGLTTYQSLLRVSLIASGVLWILCFVLLIVFSLSMRRNTRFNQGVLADIASAPHSLEKAILGKVKPAMKLLIVAAFGNVAFSLDGLPLIPPALTPLLHFLAITLIAKILTKNKKIRLFSVLATIGGVLLQLVLYMFCEAYHEIAQYDFATAKPFFSLPMSFEVIYCCFTLLSLFAVRSVLKRLIDEHTGNFWESAYTSHNSHVRKDKADQFFLLNITTVLSALLLLSNTASYYFLYTVPTYRLINAGAGIVIALLSTSLYFRILSSVCEKYSEKHEM